MSLKEIVERCSTLNVYERRQVGDRYLELVVYSKEIDKWHKIFADILGPAVKPAGVKPAQDELELTKDYGGIFQNQTLFKKDFDDGTVLAMFWPWQDETYTTLKVTVL